MPRLEVGDRIADLKFVQLDGVSVRLSEIGGPMLLIFLRHLR